MRKRFSVLLSLLLVVWCAVGTAAVDTAKFPKPPQLYAQAAILMDADTGQIIYGKNERTKMYPASLTKIMTCMLALELGKAEDIVTVSEESTKDVAGTTHIALRDGEELTLEQLEYAMMVESANDAANSIAIYLSGSTEMFAQIMNEKAQELGADATRFVNPSGLPDDNHYTTAYDLALITRAAMENPEFEKIVGTHRYEIPPTNKINETRAVANKNYMFTLNDTYDGAYGGKTGWTQEAGHCLMTLAKRGDTTLICIVLKSDGVVDAEFADSTALFDYGFDHFKRYKISGDLFPTQQVNYISKEELMESALLESDGEGTTVLLPEGVSEKDITVHAVIPDPLHEEDFGKVRVEIWVPEVASEVMGRIAGSFDVRVTPLEPVAAESQGWSIDWMAVLNVLGWLCVAFGAAGLVILLAMAKRARIARRRMMMAQIPHPEMSNEMVYWMQCHEVDLTLPGALEELRRSASASKVKDHRHATKPCQQFEEERAAYQKRKKNIEVVIVPFKEEAGVADEAAQTQPPVPSHKSARTAAQSQRMAYPAYRRTNTAKQGTQAPKTTGHIPAGAAAEKKGAAQRPNVPQTAAGPQPSLRMSASAQAPLRQAASLPNPPTSPAAPAPAQPISAQPKEKSGPSTSGGHPRRNQSVPSKGARNVSYNQNTLERLRRMARNKMKHK